MKSKFLILGVLVSISITSNTLASPGKPGLGAAQIITGCFFTKAALVTGKVALFGGIASYSGLKSKHYGTPGDFTDLAILTTLGASAVCVATGVPGAILLRSGYKNLAPVAKEFFKG